MTPPITIEQMLTDLMARIARGMRYDLTGISALLEALQHPERQLRCILVAGTNGKGSTAALLAASLRQAGHRVGLYTSPHLLHFRERIVVDGAAIDDANIAKHYQRLLALEPTLERPFTFFEGATAMALAHFAEQQVDVAVLEVGLGGRLDATNAVPTASVLACVMTPISLDHQAILGDDVGSIAREKAGIFRKGVSAFSARQQEDVGHVLCESALRVGAQWLPLEALRQTPIQVPHWPSYLCDNAQLVDAVGHYLDANGTACPARARAQARAQFTWPGRYHWLEPTPSMPAPSLLDGGHNAAGCWAFAKAIDDDRRLQGRRLHLLFSALRDKDIHGMLTPLVQRVQHVHVVECPSQRSHDLTALLAAYPTATSHKSVSTALRSIARALDADKDALIVTGSLTLVGASLDHLTAKVAPHNDS